MPLRYAQSASICWNYEFGVFSRMAWPDRKGSVCRLYHGWRCAPELKRCCIRFWFVFVSGMVGISWLVIGDSFLR